MTFNLNIIIETLKYLWKFYIELNIHNLVKYQNEIESIKSGTDQWTILKQDWFPMKSKWIFVIPCLKSEINWQNKETFRNQVLRTSALSMNPPWNVSRKTLDELWSAYHTMPMHWVRHAGTEFSAHWPWLMISNLPFGVSTQTSWRLLNSLNNFKRKSGFSIYPAFKYSLKLPVLFCCCAWPAINRGNSLCWTQTNVH